MIQEDLCLYMGDSWFGSANYAYAVKNECDHAILQVKTAHARFPKKFLEDYMKDIPGGCWIVMEVRAVQY